MAALREMTSQEKLTSLFRDWVNRGQSKTEVTLRMPVPELIMQNLAKPNSPVQLELWAAEAMYEEAKARGIDFTGKQWNIQLTGNNDLNPPELWVELTVYG